MSKEEIIQSFNPNEPGNAEAGIYSLPFTIEQSDIVLIPVPWEATVSYGSGAATGAEAIFQASFQIDLCHYDYPELWKRGIAMDEPSAEIIALGIEAKAKAASIIEALELGKNPLEDAALIENYKIVNAASEKMNKWVEERTAYWLDKNKKVGLIGGDHSTPYGFFKTLAKKQESFGILTIDAHMDFRKAFEGFSFSHASIFYNALQIKQVEKIVQVATRDYCQEELDFVKSQGNRVSVFFDKALQRAEMAGKTRMELYQEIVDELPQNVHVSFDIDGLDPSLCPNTGTPVPGGLQFEEAMFLLQLLKESGRNIIGFDLCEVAQGENDWDGNVGARLLYQLCGLIA